MAGLLDSGAFVNGPAVGSFEHAFASYCQTADAVGVASGLDALRLALLAAGIRPGDEVIVPAQTFVATLEAVTQAGGTPVPAEIGAADYNLDPAAAEAAITSRTTFLLPVHLYGQMADMQALRSLAERTGLAHRRGCLPGARGRARRPPRRRRRARGRVQLLPGEEPRRDGRRRRARPPTTRASPRRFARCASTDSGGSTTTISRAIRLGSTRSRRSSSS